MKPKEQGTYQRRYHEHRHDGPDHGALPFLLDDAQEKEPQRHFGNSHSHDAERLADGFEEDCEGDVVGRNDGDVLTEAVIGGDGDEETEADETDLHLLATMYDSNKDLRRAYKSYNVDDVVRPKGINHHQPRIQAQHDKDGRQRGQNPHDSQRPRRLASYSHDFLSIKASEGWRVIEGDAVSSTWLGLRRLTGVVGGNGGGCETEKGNTKEKKFRSASALRLMSTTNQELAVVVG